ncbi:hypothetical protein [Amycolatopsis sp. VC5-11]|uniref:hypothetical protein n=1 Tax=Amycolatopsis sp. VC5-11 TaxID=3120156 RepID=UPI00300A2E3E
MRNAMTGPQPARDETLGSGTRTFTGDLMPRHADDTAIQLDGSVFLLLGPSPMRVGIRCYSDDHPDTFEPPLRHVYLLVDLRGTWLAIHPLCAGHTATPHATQMIEPREFRSLGDDETACPRCAAWLRDNAHVVVVNGEDAVRGGPFIHLEPGPPTLRLPPVPAVPGRRTAAPAACNRPPSPTARPGAAAPGGGFGPGTVPARLAPSGFGPARPLFAVPLFSPSPTEKGVSPIQHTESRGFLCIFED